MDNENNPLVSIGVPVFNGENGLARALDSLLGQDYANLEIIISDNGSTDATSEICGEYVRKDSRVRCSRSEENLGAMWNFNRVFELSSGKYFMWAAHDDSRDKSFVRDCVEKMEQCPEAAVCQGHFEVFIEGSEELLYVIHLDAFDERLDLVERYREVLKDSSNGVFFYGLFRSSSVCKTQMLPRHLAGDMVFLQELSIYGEFVQVRKTLFNYFARSKWNAIDQDYFVFLGEKKKPWWYLPFVIVFYHNWKLVVCAPIPFSMKLLLCAALIEYQFGHVVLKILIKVAGLFCPERWKEKLGYAIYRRWIRSPNIEVGSEKLYLERVIKPRLGWWG